MLNDVRMMLNWVFHLWKFILINSINDEFFLRENYQRLLLLAWNRQKDKKLQVVRDAEDTIVPGLLAAGEASMGYGTEPPWAVHE